MSELLGERAGAATVVKNQATQPETANQVRQTLAVVVVVALTPPAWAVTAAPA